MMQLPRSSRFIRVTAGLVLALTCLFTTDVSAQRRRPSPASRKAQRLSPGADVRVAPDAPHSAAAVAAPTDYRISALMSGYKWGSTTITYSFYSDAVFGGSYYGGEVVSEVSDQVKQNVRAIMAWYGTMLNLNFVEVAETSSKIGLIRVMRSNGPSYAYAYYPSSDTMFSVTGDVHLNPSYDRLGDTNGFQNPAGEHGYLALIHEIGHALGLKHPFDGTPNLPADEDNHSHTVMSYGFPGESPGTPMGYDVMALQYLYGGKAYRTANDGYLFDDGAIDQYALGGQLFINPSLLTKQVIWDSGGYNTIDLSGFAPDPSGYRLDLRPLGWLTTNANYLTTYLNAGAVVGPGVSIQKLVNSGGNDTIYANADANLFSGYTSSRVTGADTIYDADGADTIDLSGYTPAQVTQTASGNDLVLALGSNGSITVKGYYLQSTPPTISYGGVIPAASIADATVVEGNSGTTNAVFTVSLSAPAAGGESVMVSTVNGSATAGSDFTAVNTPVTFLAGETQRSVAVAIIGDTAVESDETFSVQLSAPSAGLTIGDGVGLGTIANDDQAPNQLPVAVVTATPTTGTAPLAVSFSGAGSSDPDGSIVTYAWTFGDGGTSGLVSPSHTYASAGTYTATLNVTDNRGGTASMSVTITVQADPNAVLSVGGITMVLVSRSGGAAAQATVLIRRADGTPVSGVSVAGTWSGLVAGNASVTTDATGRAVFVSKATKRHGTFTFAVTGASKTGFTYDASQNAVSSASISR
jgi:serralysin